MRKFLTFFLILPSLAFSQGKLNGTHLGSVTTLNFKAGTLATLKGSRSLPLNATISFGKGDQENITITAIPSTDVATVTRDLDSKGAATWPDNADVSVTDSKIYKDGATVPTTKLYTSDSAANLTLKTTQLPTGPALKTYLSIASSDVSGLGALATKTQANLASDVTGTLPVSNGGASQGVTAMTATTGTITVPMSSAIYTVTPTGAMTWNASLGSAIGQFTSIVITTSGTTTFTMTPGTNFKSATLATGTTSGKVFKMLFRWDGSVWQEFSRTAAQ